MPAYSWVVWSKSTKMLRVEWWTHYGRHQGVEAEGEGLTGLFKEVRLESHLRQMRKQQVFLTAAWCSRWMFFALEDGENLLMIYIVVVVSAANHINAGAGHLRKHHMKSDRPHSSNRKGLMSDLKKIRLFWSSEKSSAMFHIEAHCSGARNWSGLIFWIIVFLHLRPTAAHLERSRCCDKMGLTLDLGRGDETWETTRNKQESDCLLGAGRRQQTVVKEICALLIKTSHNPVILNRPMQMSRSYDRRGKKFNMVVLMAGDESKWNQKIEHGPRQRKPGCSDFMPE